MASCAPTEEEACRQLLKQLGALDGSKQLTPLGVQLARLPLDPQLGAMLVAASKAQGTPFRVLQLRFVAWAGRQQIRCPPGSGKTGQETVSESCQPPRNPGSLPLSGSLGTPSGGPSARTGQHPCQYQRGSLPLPPPGTPGSPVLTIMSGDWFPAGR